MKRLLLKEWNNCNKLKMFEIEVYNECINENDYIIYNIYYDKKNGLLWTSSIDGLEPITMNIDMSLSLDVNLQAFYDLCIDDIMEADDYNLR